AGAVHLRHRRGDEDQIGPEGRDAFERLAARAADGDREAAHGLERETRDCLDVRVVLDHEDPPEGSRRGHFNSESSTWKAVPRPVSVSKLMRPPSRSTIALVMLSP